MTISTFGTLKTAIATRLARSDMTALIPDFVEIAHAKMMRGDDADNVPPLRFADMLTEASLTPSGGAATLPATYLEMKSVYSDASESIALQFVPPDTWRSFTFSWESGEPRWFTVENLTLRIGPANTTTLKVLYYAALTALSADSDTNAVITKAPHAYLYGALAEAYDHIRQHDRAKMYGQRFASAIRALNDTSDNGQVSGAPLRMMPGAVV